MKEKMVDWMAQNPIVAVCIMAAAEFCAIVWIVSVYLS